MPPAISGVRILPETMPATDLIHPGETRNCTVQGVQRIILRQHLDERGPLCVLGQGAAALPFVPQRLFFTSGVKGTRRGGAVVSPRHANFVVNDGSATAADVLALLDLVRETVRARTGVELELEVKVWRRRA